MALHRRRFVASCAASALLSGTALAQDYPSRMVRVVVPQPSGGPSDGLTRYVAEQLRTRLNQNVVVENRPGAGGAIGLAEAARAAPDGYTLAQVATFTYSINPVLYPKLAYQPERDFRPVAIFAKTSNILYINPNKLPVQTLSELIAHIKANPGKVNGAFPGVGNSSQIALALLKKQNNLDFVEVPFQGDAQAMVQLTSGQVDLIFSVNPTANTLVEAGKLRAIAVAGPSRSPALPKVPTFAEAGMKNFLDTTAFFGLVTNAAVPDAIAERLNREINHITDTPQFRGRLQLWGMTPTQGSLKEIGAFLGAERTRWQRAVPESGAKVD